MDFITAAPSVGLSIGLIFAAVLGSVAWKRPEYGVALFIGGGRFLMAIEITGLPAGPLVYLAYPVALIFLCRIGSLLLTPGARSVARAGWAYLAVIGWTIINYGIQGELEGSPSMSRLREFVLFQTLPVLAIWAISHDERRLHRFANALVAILALVTSGFVVVGLEALAAGSSGYELRYSTLLGVPMFVAGNSLVFIVALASWTHAQAARTRMAALLLLTIGALALVMAQGRGAIVMSALSVAYLLLREKRAWRTYSLVVAVAVVAAIGLWELPQQSYRVLMEALNDRVEKTVVFEAGISDSSRLDLWNQAWSTFVASPVVGAGIGNATEAIQFESMDAYRPGAHHYILETLSENGLIGLFFALWFFAAVTSAVRCNHVVQARHPDLRVVERIASAAFVTGAISCFVGGPDHLYWAGMLSVVVNEHSVRGRARSAATFAGARISTHAGTRWVLVGAPSPTAAPTVRLIGRRISEHTELPAPAVQRLRRPPISPC